VAAFKATAEIMVDPKALLSISARTVLVSESLAGDL